MERNKKKMQRRNRFCFNEKNCYNERNSIVLDDLLMETELKYTFSSAKKERKYIEIIEVLL